MLVRCVAGASLHGVRWCDTGRTMQETRLTCVTLVAEVSAGEPTSTCTSVSILRRDRSGVRPVGSNSARARTWASTRGSTQESSPTGVGLVEGTSGTIQSSRDTRGCAQGRSRIPVPCVGRGLVRAHLPTHQKVHCRERLMGLGVAQPGAFQSPGGMPGVGAKMHGMDQA